MENNFTVYMHIAPNDKKYIGITSYKVSRRWRKQGRGYKEQIFYRAIQKYGWDNMEHIIVAKNLTKEKACQIEIDLIKKYNTTNKKYGYNISTGGDASGYGVKLTKEQVEVIVNRFSIPVYQFTRDGVYIKRWNSASVAARSLNIDSSLISHNCRKETNFACGFYWTFINDSIFNKNPIGSIGFKNYVKTRFYIGSQLNRNGKKINQYTKNGEFIRKWNSAHEIKRELNIGDSAVIKVCKCNGANSSAGGFIWRYEGSLVESVIKYKKTGKKINQYTINSKYIKTWDNARQIKESLNFDDSSIYKVCRKVHKQAYGYIWKYVEN